MILFLLFELVFLAVLFFSWYIYPETFSVGYVLYHSYPVLIGLIALMRANWVKTKKSKPMTKALVLLIPFALWVVGVLYIAEFY